MKIKKRVSVLTGLIALFVVATVFFAQREFSRINVLNAHATWQSERLAELKDDTSGWLNLAGLFWLEDGASSMGSAANNNFVLSEGNAPDHLGVFLRKGEEITFVAEKGISVLVNDRPVNGEEAPAGRIALVDDDEGYGQPTVLSFGNLQWWIIERDGLMGVRVRDLESAHATNFAGIESYEYNPNWKINAQFLAFDSPRAFEYPTILGTMRTENAPGVLVFEQEGRQFEMVPFERNNGTQLFLVFGDQTNGDQTYNGGRFLYVAMPDETGETTIDFNRAYNPPCAFSDYSTCPQPLRQNKLPVAVDAGEKVYRKH